MKRLTVFTLTFLMAIFLAFSAYGEVKQKVFTVNVSNLRVVGNEVQVKLSTEMVNFVKNSFGPKSKIAQQSFIVPNTFIVVKNFSPEQYKICVDKGTNVEAKLETDGNSLEIILQNMGR
jgi:hypothetical protein